MSKGGRPKVELEDITVDGWKYLDSLIIFASEEYCAEQLGVSVSTLQRRIKENYQCGFDQYKEKRREGLKLNLLKKQYDVAMSGNVSMLIWLGKNILGQSDKQTISNTDKPFKKAFNMDKTPEELFKDDEE